MFSIMPSLALQREALEAMRQPCVDLMREFFPQILTWRIARINAACIEFAQWPVVFSRTFQAALSESSEGNKPSLKKSTPARPRRTSRNKIKASAAAHP